MRLKVNYFNTNPRYKISLQNQTVIAKTTKHTISIDLCNQIDL